MFSEYNFRTYSLRLMLTAVVLNIIGIIAIYSAENGALEYTSRQLAGLVFGVVICIGVSLIDYHRILRFSAVIYIVCIVSLAAVMLVGQLGGGSRRWITIPFIGRFQPSEFVKIGLILFFAWFLQRNQERINSPVTLAITFLLAIAPVLMIMMQPDLSTAIVIIVLVVCMVFVAGISYKWIIGGILVAVPAFGIFAFLSLRGMIPFIEPYQVNRILAFLNLGDSEQLSSLNLQQDNSMMAIGSGGLYGKGLFQDTAISVKNGNFLSEEHTDFIFSIIGEEMGFVGCMLVLAAFLLLLLECIRIANRSRDLSGKLICIGVAALIGFQAFTNVAVVTGLFPNTGLTLPFISYGVSSLISSYIGVGMILNVSLQQRKPET